MKTKDGSEVGSGAFGSKVVRVFAIALFVVSATALYSYMRVERVQSNIENVNQFYIPVLKHLKVIGG